MTYGPFKQIPMANKTGDRPGVKPGLETVPPDIFEVMREKDVEAFSYTAWWWNCYILVRRSNPQSIKYIGMPGYIPKGPDTKAKTAHLDVGINTPDGQPMRREVAGLVCDPTTVTVMAYKTGKKFDSAMKEWRKFVATGRLCEVAWGEDGTPSRAHTPSGAPFVVDRRPYSRHYGALMKDTGNGIAHASYIHGDYDLFAIVNAEHPSVNVVVEEQHAASPAHPLRMRPGETVEPHQEVKNFRGPEFTDVQNMLNRLMGVNMVLHGSQEKAVDTFDDEIDCFLPNGTEAIFLKGRELENFYAEEFGGRQLFRFFAGADQPRITGRRSFGQWRRR